MQHLPAIKDQAAPALSPARPSPRAAGAMARRRRTLLQLARRHGEVRLRTAEAGRGVRGAAAVSELLDNLNEDGLLRYGGLRVVEGGCELVYLAA